MGIGYTYIHFLYPDQDKVFLTERLQRLWKHFQTQQDEEMEYVFDEYEGGTLWINFEPVSVMLDPYTATDPPEIARGPAYTRLELAIDTDQQIRMAVEGEDTDATERYVSGAVAAIAEVYELIDEKSTVGYGVPGNYREAIGAGQFNHPISEESLTENRLEYIPWLVILPPPFVQTYGRDNLLSAPAWHTEELTDGAVLIAAYYDLIKGNDLDTAPLNHHLDLPDPWEDIR